MLTASPIAVARASNARRAREAAAELTRAADAAPMQGPARRRRPAPATTARMVVRPSSLASWHAWLERLHISVDQVALTATYAVATGRHGGMPVQLIGHGVPALIRAGRKDRI